MYYAKVTLLLVAMAIIFAIDTIMNLEIAVAMFYAPLLLLASGRMQRAGLLSLAGLCCALTVVSFYLTTAGLWRIGLLNTGLSLAMLALTTWQVLAMQAARSAAEGMQAQLQRTARARQLEGLATSIAHEINQPLAAIGTSSDAAMRWLAHQPPALDKAQQTLERIRSDAERASSIIARVRNLSRGGPVQRSAFALHQAIHEVQEWLQTEIQRCTIDCQTDCAVDLPQAWADRIQVQQVMSNILLNAIEAVASEAKGIRSIHIQVRQQNDMLVVSTTDNGAGISKQAQKHLFDAFWSSKPNGMGVGLAICRTMIEANGGQIWLESSVLGKTIFQFSVPIVTTN